MFVLPVPTRAPTIIISQLHCERMRVGVIGVGSTGQNHVKTIVERGMVG
jgi:cell division GTPase FtsZ